MKLRILAFLIIMSLTLTGCIKKYEIPNEKSDVIAEYMAGKLLENQNSYTKNLVPETDIETIEPTTLPSPTILSTPTPVQVTGNAIKPTKKPVKEFLLSKILGTTDFKISYKNYQIVDSYTYKLGNTISTQSPKDGYHYLIINFSIENLTNETKTFSLIKKNVQYILSDHTGLTSLSIFTLKENDMQYINQQIPSRGTTNALVLFEIPKNDQSVQRTLKVVFDQKVSTILLQD